MKKLFTLVICCVFSILLCAPAMAEKTPVKTYTFDKKKAPKEWSAGKTFIVAGDRRLGLFNDRNKRYPSHTVLTIKDIPADSAVTVKFDILYIGSWDSEGKLADSFKVSVVDGPEVMNITTFPCILEDGDDNRPVNHNGFVQVGERERAFWIAPISFSVPASAIKDGELELEFKGFLTGRKTEFWALDNLNVYID